MKRTKSILAVVLAFALVLACGIVAFAAETYKITITNESPNHIYEAYQIFAGDLHIDGDRKILSNIVWGSGITEAGKIALGNAEERAKSLTTEADAKVFAKEVAKYLLKSTESVRQADGKYVISGLDAGYYLVKDKDNTLNNADDFNTAYIMQVVGDVQAVPKGDKPSLDKQIKHNESATWGVVGDNQIGDTVEFRIITTVPDTAEYTQYDYIIHDTMSVGLSSNVKTAADVTIKVNDTGDALSADYYTVTANGNTFSVKVDIIKAVNDGIMSKGDELYTYYTGVLNEDAKVYDEGKQDNVAFLEYSNNPNNDEKGKTEEKKVYDWTFKMTVNKVDGEGNNLTGAKFVLSKDGTLKVADLNCNEEGVPAATEKLIGLVKVSEGVYRVAVKGDADVVYVIDAGEAVIKGLDDAIDYYFYETKAPAGYNLLKEPVNFKISADYNTDGSEYTTVTATVGDAQSENLKANVVNNQGTELPSTGGVGTTIFYIVGAVLVAAAGILLITKKRMSKASD